MTEAQQEHISQRLNHALDLAGIPRKGKGRQMVVASMFGVSQKAVSKWLEGSAIPETKRLQAIAQKLDVQFEWLMTGRGAINFTAPAHTEKNQVRRIPILSTDEVSHWAEVSTTATTPFIFTDIIASPKTYAVVIDEISPQNYYQSSAIFIVDPLQKPRHGNKIMVRWRSNNAISCMQFIVNGAHFYLQALDPSLAAILIDEKTPQIEICGTVRQIIINC